MVVTALFDYSIFWLSCNATSKSESSVGLWNIDTACQALTVSRLLLHKAERVPKCGDTPLNLGDVRSWAVSYFHTLPFLLFQISSFNCWPHFFSPYPHKSHMENGGPGWSHHQPEGEIAEGFWSHQITHTKTRQKTLLFWEIQPWTSWSIFIPWENTMKQLTWFQNTYFQVFK